MMESKYRRYHKFPNWPPVQPEPVSDRQNADYHISLNDSGNVMFITTNDNGNDHNINEQSDIPYDGHHQPRNLSRSNIGHMSPRKWHHGDLRPDLMEVNLQKDSGSNPRNKAGYNYDHVKNPGQITIHYNGIDLSNALPVNEKRGLFVDKGLARNSFLGLSNEENNDKSNFDQLKKEYMDRSRAKEMEYKLQREGEANRVKTKDHTSTIIRYDIEAPVNGGLQARNFKTQIFKDNNSFLRQTNPAKREFPIEGSGERFAKEGSCNSSPQLGLSGSITLPKYGAETTKNTRFGSHGKVTAYRPSTCLDNHRKKKLENIIEVPVHDIDVEEGRRIWKEVDSITKEPLVAPPSPRRRMTYRARDTHKSNNSVEFFPGFDREPRISKELENNLWTDKENDEHHRLDKNDNWRNVLDPTKSPKAVDVSKYGKRKPRGRLSLPVNEFMTAGTRELGRQEPIQVIKRHSSAPILQLTDDNDNLHFIAKYHDLHPDLYNTRDDVNRTVTTGSSRNGNIHLVYQAGHHANNYEQYIHVPQSGACKGASLRMATTLPRITPANTPLPPGVVQTGPPRSHSSASMYGAYPPKDLSSSVDFLKVPGRINPLAPPPPRKRINWTWETTNQHWENEKRRILMQKREHTRYHSAWSKAFYGAPAEKEAYRRHFRDVLKQQMADRENSRRDEMINKVKETERAVKYDEQCRTNDAQEYFRKQNYLMFYRDGNKQQMEDKWAEKRFNKVAEDRIDRERLRYNPINWSCSLK